MARILAIDYGTKRVGVAVTDPLGMIAGALATVETPRIFDFLSEYLTVNDCNRLVIGYPLFAYHLHETKQQTNLFTAPFLCLQTQFNFRKGQEIRLPL